MTEFSTLLNYDDEVSKAIDSLMDYLNNHNHPGQRPATKTAAIKFAILAMAENVRMEATNETAN